MLKGVFSTYCIKDLQANGLLRLPSYDNQEKKDHDLFAVASENIRTSSIIMQRYFRILFVFENSVRDFIQNTFFEIDGTDWFTKRSNRDMKTKLEKRKANEQKNQWHTGRNEHPIFYMDFGDLSKLIINHWDVFQDYFPDQAWVTSRISDSERSRNVIAHTNILASEEGQRLEMHLRDWINQIG
ncbi:Swt1 family HEPN domain-containing protein [Tenacibaculum sp. 1_MG-2023]|uniref:Swt1 family HEPN domain-containing protein n=1 Tax=Tenacibaculum sp. 1_MG-2023 TaxID=3062653 RepID=UPI0026E421F5|nr:Swt1 family HEPN domain-containing protein [Tenacibaculum sp. 1_MG-2023]MDO6674579.1 Swt1 family HEPN domain-containing protein [Tenacibaculum sp. 1_MG-2023]